MKKIQHVSEFEGKNLQQFNTLPDLFKKHMEELDPNKIYGVELWLKIYRYAVRVADACENSATVIAFHNDYSCEQKFLMVSETPEDMEFTNTMRYAACLASCQLCDERNS